MDSPEKIRARLQRDVPGEVDQGVVMALVERWFAGYWDRPPTGSHFCVIDHGWLSLRWPNSNGTLSRSARRGRVKKYQVEMLLTAIDVIEEGRRQGVDEPPPRRR
ncbi:MAG: hypothetical protein HYU66_15305 [Armatimonadetes bacterium]|nr:hypothetical protein [Armatimonadota bacterium]